MTISLWVLQIMLSLHTLMGALWKFSNSEQAVVSLKALPHGVWLAMDRWLNFKPARRWQTWLMAALNFHIVGVGWVLFRAGSLAAAGRFLAGMAAFSQMEWWGTMHRPCWPPAAWS